MKAEGGGEGVPAPPVFLRSGPPSRERRAGRGAALAQTQGLQG